jgi:hypothetical protein
LRIDVFGEIRALLPFRLTGELFQTNNWKKLNFLKEKYHLSKSIFESLHLGLGDLVVTFFWKPSFLKNERK